MLKRTSFSSEDVEGAPKRARGPGSFGAAPLQPHEQFAAANFAYALQKEGQMEEDSMALCEEQLPPAPVAAPMPHAVMPWRPSGAVCPPCFAHRFCRPNVPCMVESMQY